jgi:hypothetical protein
MGDQVCMTPPSIGRRGAALGEAMHDRPDQVGSTIGRRK